MKLVFCGTPRFAVPTLEQLVAESFAVELIITNPDEPRGRGQAVMPSSIKQAALQAGLKVYQPARLKDPAAQAGITAAHPDAIVVVAYGHLIPPWMIELPPYGCVNLHASLLPHYRGAAPIPWAIMRGEKITGLTTMKIDRGLDTGDILLQKEVEIEDEDTTESLSQRLSILGAGLMVETLLRLERGEIRPRPQDHAAATLAPMLKKEDGNIDWSLKAEEIARRVRGLRPWPVAHTIFRGRSLQLWMARPLATASHPWLAQGELRAEHGSLMAGCGAHSAVEIMELQLEGRKRLSARDFMNGVRLKAGEKFAG